MKPLPPGQFAPVTRGIPGAIVVCVKCGQVRKVTEDGVVEIVIQGGQPVDEDTVTPQTL